MDPHEKYINDLAVQIHADCVKAGWWDNPDRCLYECLQLVSTEVAEATEGARKDLMDDHLPHYKMEEVEYADALIRVLDLGGKMEFIYSKNVSIAHSFCTAYSSIGKQHLGLNCCVINLSGAIMDYAFKGTETYKGICDIAYGDLIRSIFQVAHNRGFPLIEAMEEKLVYNKTRFDHTQEHRASKHGKKF